MEEGGVAVQVVGAALEEEEEEVGAEVESEIEIEMCAILSLAIKHPISF